MRNRIGDTVSAGDLIDKTLIALREVPVYKSPSDKAQPFSKVRAGQPVGVVFSYILPGEQSTRLWWMFRDGNDVAYYAPHMTGWYDFNALQAQGVLTTEERIENEQMELDRDRLSTLEFYVKYYLPKYGIWVIGAIVAAAAVRGYLSRPSNRSNEKTAL